MGLKFHHRRCAQFGRGCVFLPCCSHTYNTDCQEMSGNLIFNVTAALRCYIVAFDMGEKSDILKECACQAEWLIDFLGFLQACLALCGLAGGQCVVECAFTQCVLEQEQSGCRREREHFNGLTNEF